MTGELEQRCADGAACVEVLARVTAAHVARYVDRDDAAAELLLAAARRWAEVHGHGSPDRFEAAS